jgi:IS605 OrfB family transposase
VAAECFDLSKLIKKDLSSNKRNFEIGNLYTKIFDLCTHYKVGTFCVENLTFKRDVTEENNREFNRLTKNVWNLGLQTRLARKHCIERGIIYREVNPTYTSVIGNLRYDYPDPICAAVEIGRKGSVMYDKGSVALIRFQEHEVKAALKRRTKMDFDGDKLSNWNDVKKIAGSSIRVGVGDYPDVRCNFLISKRTNMVRQSMTERMSPLICYV